MARVVATKGPIRHAERSGAMLSVDVDKYGYKSAAVVTME
jgi:hypothetical protein